MLKKVTSAVAGLAVVFSIVSPLAGVSAAYTSLEAANKLATLGVIVDQSANPADYRLGDTISRREQVKLAMNLASCQAVTVADSCTGVYSDLSSSDWGCKYAESAYNNGFIAGNAMFYPNRDVSKAEALKMIMNATGIQKGADSSWEAAYVDGGVQAGIVSSFSDYTTAATRGWIFQVAADAVDLCGSTDNSDDLLGSLLDGLGDTTDSGSTDTTNSGSTDTPVVSGDSEAMVSLSPENPANGYVAVNTPRAMMLAFDVTAGDTDVTLKSATFNHIGLGNKKNVTNVTIYDSKNATVSKTKSFGSSGDLTITFDKDIVVKAGETQTFFVGATIADDGSANTTYQIQLSNLTASTAVVGGSVTGAALVPTKVSNSALLKITADTANDSLTVGEESVLAGFTVKEENNNEDVIIKTVTFHQNGSINSEDLSDLTLYVDGVAVASNLTINNSDDLVANIDYVLGAKDKVSFELRGTPVAGVGDSVHFQFEQNDDVYAVGATTGFNVGFDNNNTPNIDTDDYSPENTNIADAVLVDGAEINTAFVKSGIDESKINVDDVLVGTLNLSTTTSDYEIKKIQVTVSGTGKNAIDDLKLDGISYDKITTGGSDVYEFQDITLNSGVDLALALEADIKDDTIYNNTSVTFTIKIAEVKDDGDNITYTIGGTNDIGDILSSNSFSAKTIDINNATFTLTKVKVNDRQLVLGNGIETVLYKGKISVGDSDDVTIKDFDFANNGSILGGVALGTLDFKDVIDSAELNIGGKTYTGKVNSSTIDFSSINKVIAAGSDNVEMLLTVVLKDNSGILNNDKLAVVPSVGNVNLEDSDNNSISTTGVSPAGSTSTTLLSNGTLTVKVKTDFQSDDDLENTVLAGESNVVIAELDIEALYEDVKAKDLAFKVLGNDFSNTLDNVRLVAGSKTLASGAIVTYDGTDTVITFKGDNTFYDADDLVKAELVADLNPITGQGDAVSAVAGDMVVSGTATVTKATGVSSNDELTGGDLVLVGANGETVSVVPTILRFSVVDTLSSGAAKVKITADSGNNTVGISNKIPEVTLKTLVISELGNNTDGYKLYKDGAAGTVIGPVAPSSNQVTFDMTTGGIDNTFDASQTYIIVPVGTVDKTYSLVLSGDVATYDVDTTPVTSSTTNLSSDVSLGSKSY